MRLSWHSYKYYPYEGALGAREAQALFAGASVCPIEEGCELAGSVNPDRAQRLTYFSSVSNGELYLETQQSLLERAVTFGKNRQATRYSVHGMHEYKGKFNPQIAKALLNIFDVNVGDHVLDPFCGSGTTLVECAHLGVVGLGTDINPLAVYIANAKLQALVAAPAILRDLCKKLARSTKDHRSERLNTEDLRIGYLKAWFDAPTLQLLEFLRNRIERICGLHAPFFLMIASNLLRDYSLQDPHDLRIRRRKTPLPKTPFLEAFFSAVRQAISRLESAQSVLGSSLALGKAICQDIRYFNLPKPRLFDAGITSPPYAMALPYIDTQRLSLVWLGLLDVSCILSLEAELIGSRELRGASKRSLVEKFECNASNLPLQTAAFCAMLQRMIGQTDGFRRRAVPMLLYRYFTAMRDSFQSISKLLKPSAPFALVVGHNHTVLGGTRIEIDTPSHLVQIAEDAGWQVRELLHLQTYQRYGYHMENAVSTETLIMLRNR
jgi:adenine-specific DNA methylase